jgi:hypothetical protein
MLLKNLVFWDVTLHVCVPPQCNLKQFCGICLEAEREEAADTSKMLAHIYKTIRCHIPDSICPENLKIFKTNNFTFFIVSWDLSQPLGSLDETYKTSSIVGWLTSIGQDGKVLAIPKGRLGN